MGEEGGLFIKNLKFNKICIEDYFNVDVYFDFTNTPHFKPDITHQPQHFPTILT